MKSRVASIKSFAKRKLHKEKHYPLPGDVQVIIVAYLMTAEEIEKYKSSLHYTSTMTGSLFALPSIMILYGLMGSIGTCRGSIPKRVRIPMIALGLAGVPIAGAAAIAASAVTLPMDIATQITQEVAKQKNKNWATFFVDPESSKLEQRQRPKSLELSESSSESEDELPGNELDVIPEENDFLRYAS